MCVFLTQKCFLNKMFLLIKELQGNPHGDICDNGFCRQAGKLALDMVLCKVQLLKLKVVDKKIMIGVVPK